MDSKPRLLAEQIYQARPENKEEIIKRIREANPFSWEFMTPYRSFSPLVWALHKGYKDIATETIAKLPQNELLNSFILEPFYYHEAQEIASLFFLKLLDFNQNVFPPHIRSIIEDLRSRRRLAVLTGSEGESDFLGVPWRMEGYHDETNSHILFASLLKNQDKIIAGISEKAERSDLIKDKVQVLINAIKQTISLMQEIQTLTPKPAFIPEVLPILTGNYGRQGSTGFVVFDGQLLLEVNLNRKDKPGVIVYKLFQGFDKELFNNFLIKEKNGVQGTIFELNFEAAMDYSTETDYIPVGPAKADSVMAASEGLFLAALYCLFIKLWADPLLAKNLVLEYTPPIFETNIQCEIEAFKKSLPTEDPFLEQLGKKNPVHRLVEKRSERTLAEQLNDETSIMKLLKKLNLINQPTTSDLNMKPKNQYAQKPAKLINNVSMFPHSSPVAEDMPLLKSQLPVLRFDKALRHRIWLLLH